MNKVLIIGCGHMGSALLTAWQKLKLYKFTVVDPFNYKLIEKKFRSKKVIVKKSIQDLKNTSDYDLMVIAVTPQVIKSVLKEYKSFKLKKNAVIVSIVAGKKIDFFKKNLVYAYQVIRVMPNMPSLIEKGMSCLVGNKYVSKKNKIKTTNLFSKVGKTLWLSNENQLDMATAVSGSGPGYVFTILDAIEKGAINVGFSKKIANLLVLETILGSIFLKLKLGKSSKELANLIAIKGGTTEAGIKVMKKNKIYSIFSKTIKAAYNRASFLGKNRK